MLRVTIDINGHIIWQSIARRIHPLKAVEDMKPNTLGTYIVDEKHFVKHKYGDGAKKLAIKLLRLWGET